MLLALTMRTHSQPLGPNLRCGQSLGEDGVVALREDRSEIMCLKMLLKRRQGRAIADLKVLRN